MEQGISVLVTNCSARKSVRGADGLSSAALTRGNQDAVAEQWMAKIGSAEAVSPASEMYTGRGIKRMNRLAGELNAPLYIASAGLGLLKANERVPCYDLSVSTGYPSAVQRRVTGGFAHQDWWRTVQQSKYARPISDLFKGQERGLVVLALSNAYVPLLVGALLNLPDEQRDRLRLFGAGDARYPAELHRFLMPYDSRLDALVRGSKVDFAQRAAEHFISGSDKSDFPRCIDDQRRWVEVSLGRVTATARQKREVVDDARIRQIARMLASQGYSYTNALNALRRKHGIACEQSRFRRLFLEVIK